MLQTRKNVLDKARTELADSVNASNQIYTNEELSVIVGELKNKNNLLESEMSELKSENQTLKEQNAKLENNFNTFKNSSETFHNINKFYTFTGLDDLNDVTEKTPATLTFGTGTLNKPSNCNYGVLVNHIYGQAPKPGVSTTSYWRFQMAFCTDGSVMTRRAINNSAWTSWIQL